LEIYRGLGAKKFGVRHTVNETILSYDDNNSHPISITDVLGAVTTFTYNISGQLQTLSFLDKSFCQVQPKYTPQRRANMYRLATYKSRV
jgi:YD repeat-containing protein